MRACRIVHDVQTCAQWPFVLGKKKNGELVGIRYAAHAVGELLFGRCV